MNWKDHRPIGEINLAGPQINVPTNPRRWIMNFGQIDVTNDKGKAAFRDALLKFADNSIQVLKDIGAQGMITWMRKARSLPVSAITEIRALFRPSPRKWSSKMTAPKV